MGSIPGEDEGIPSWLNRELIANALKGGEPTTDKSSVQLMSVRKVGGGLLSETYRAVAQNGSLGEACNRRQGTGACERETSLIVKSSPAVGGLLKELADSGVFTKETIAYSSFLPAVDAALKAAEGQRWEALAPKFYYHGSQPASLLVVEDLDAAGFRSVPPGVSLDVHQCRAALRSLARMHAASVALLHHQQYADKLFREALIFSRRVLDSTPKNEDGLRLMLTVLDDCKWLHKYKDKLLRLSPRFLEEAVDAVEKCQVDFKVMVHGDLHKNNMMFREDSAGLQVRFYDFQGIHIGSPAEDLQYFLHTSASVEVLRDHTEGLLSEYHGVLQQTLRSLGLNTQADAYPLRQLLRDMDHFRMIAVFITFTILPIMLRFGDLDFSVDTSDPQFEEKSKKFHEKSWRNKIYIQYLEHLVPAFDSKGFLD